jgi:hypothetical protein
MATAKKKVDSAEPWISNYPPLEAWLHADERSHCMWQTRTPNGRDMIECWLVNGRPTIVLVYGDRHGWDIFTSANTGDIAKTLADADERTKAPYT